MSNRVEDEAPAVVTSLLPETDEERTAAFRWAEARLERSLLVLGDLTIPLRRRARHFVCRSAGSGELRGLAVRFDGFSTAVASLVADDEEAARALIGRLRTPGAVLVLSAEQPAPELGPAASADPWMTAPTADVQVRPPHDRAEPIEDAFEMADLLRRANMSFWCPEMLHFGHAFGVRDGTGRLVAAAGVNFVLEGLAYAQLGPLVTDPSARGRSLGSQSLAAVRSSLARAGVTRCGLFAEGGVPDLVAYYERRGFVRSGEFRFFSAYDS